MASVGAGTLNVGNEMAEEGDISAFRHDTI
jgi:hypothetical protein